MKNNNFGPEGRALVEINDILVEHTNAAGRNALADGPRLVGTVNPEKRVLVTLPKI